MPEFDDLLIDLPENDLEPIELDPVGLARSASPGPIADVRVRKTVRDNFIEQQDRDHGRNGEWRDIKMTEDELDAQAEFMEWWTKVTAFAVEQGYLRLSRYDLFDNFFWNDSGTCSRWFPYSEEEALEAARVAEAERLAREERYAQRAREAAAAAGSLGASVGFASGGIRTFAETVGFLSSTIEPSSAANPLNVSYTWRAQPVAEPTFNPIIDNRVNP